MAEVAGVEDTISWWNDDYKKNTFNVLVRPEMKYSSKKVTREGNTIKINSYIKFKGDADDIFPNQVGDNQLTYGEVAAKGIVNNWNKNYTNNGWYDFNGNNIKVITTLHSKNPPKNTVLNNIFGEKYSTKNQYVSFEKLSSNQKYFVINIDNTILNKKYDKDEDYVKEHNINDSATLQIPHAVKWGDWSVDSTSEVNMYRAYNTNEDYTQFEYGQTLAHEFGHVLGLDDAYGNIDDGGIRPDADDNIEVGIDDEFYTGNMMRENGSAIPNDVEMVWEAFRTNKWQYYKSYNNYTKSKVIRYQK